MQVVAVLRQVFVVAGIEGETVAARLQFGDVVVALPVFVARRAVRIETEIVGTFERLLRRDDCQRGDKKQKVVKTGSMIAMYRFIIIRFVTMRHIRQYPLPTMLCPSYRFRHKSDQQLKHKYSITGMLSIPIDTARK